jgi:hypothetical protein
VVLDILSALLIYLEELNLVSRGFVICGRPTGLNSLGQACQTGGPLPCFVLPE